MDEDLTLPEDIETLTVEALREMHGRWTARITELRELDSRTIAEAREMRRLVEEANQMSAVVNAVTGDEPALEDLPEDAPVVEEEPVVEEAAPVIEEVPAPADATPIAAGVTAAELVLPGAGVPASEAPVVARAAFRASAGQQTVPSNAALSIEELGEVFEDARRNALSSREMPKTYLASVNRFAETPQRLSAQNGTAANTALINDMPQNPRTAAICGPLDVVRSIPDCVENGRPIRDLFRQIPADRGAFLFQRSVGLADVADGTGEWTDADQAAVDPSDPSTWKQCHALVCQPAITAEVDAIFRCLTTDVKQEFSNPEQVQNNINTLSAATDRLAEGLLLRQIDSLSSAYTFTGAYGAIAQLAALIARVTAKGLDTIRATESNYVAVIPQGLLQQLMVDDISRAFDNESDACDAIASMLLCAGIDRFVVTPDPAFGDVSPWAAFALNPPGAAPVVLPPAPSTWTIRIIDPAAGFFFSTGEIAFGMQRSPELYRQNKIQWFGEQFEGLNKQGCIPWFTIDATLCPDGSRAGAIVPVACPLP